MVTIIATLVQIGIILVGWSVANKVLFLAKSGSFGAQRNIIKRNNLKIVQTIDFNTMARGLMLEDKILIFKLDCLKLLQKLQNKDHNITYSMISHSLTKRALSELSKINVIKNLKFENSKPRNLIGEKIFLGNFKSILKSPFKKQSTHKMQFQIGDKKITNELIYELLGDSAKNCYLTYNKDGTIKDIKYNIFKNGHEKIKSKNIIKNTKVENISEKIKPIQDIKEEKGNTLEQRIALESLKKQIIRLEEQKDLENEKSSILK